MLTRFNNPTLFRILLFIIICIGGIKSYAQQHLIPCSNCPTPCMQVSLVNHTGCEMTWLFEYPGCSMNPGILLAPGASHTAIGYCGKCTQDGPCGCPITFSLLQKNAAGIATGGVINNWGNFNVWTFPSVVEYHNLGYGGCGCVDFWVRITIYSASSCQYDIYCS